MTRPCTKCGVTKPLSEFAISRNQADGRHTQCRVCKAADMRAYRARVPEANCYQQMLQRCHNVRNARFADYGGRGITVCDEWRGEGGFERFLSHVGPRPSSKHSIDRIDNARGYEPGNVRWATPSLQNRNRRASGISSYRGVTWMGHAGGHWAVQVLGVYVGSFYDEFSAACAYDVAARGHDDLPLNFPALRPDLARQRAELGRCPVRARRAA